MSKGALKNYIPILRNLFYFDQNLIATMSIVHIFQMTVT